MGIAHAYCLANWNALDHNLNLHWAMAGELKKAAGENPPACARAQVGPL
jgi:hypothetical protein